MLRDNLESVYQRIRKTSESFGRPLSEVVLIGVTKGVPTSRIREALSLGLADIGENRVQEARSKQVELSSWLKAQDSRLETAAKGPDRVRWHLIGHLQRNKAGIAVELFDVIHSVDSLVLIEELERQASKRKRVTEPERPLEVLLQVNVSGEKTKFGCLPDDALSLARAVAQQNHLKLCGLMTLAPFSENPEEARPYFRRLRQLRDSLVPALSLEPQALSLSMGMSHDFEVAIEEGADIVRIGSAIFGERAR